MKDGETCTACTIQEWYGEFCHKIAVEYTEIYDQGLGKFLRQTEDRLLDKLSDLLIP